MGQDDDAIGDAVILLKSGLIPAQAIPLKQKRKMTRLYTNAHFTQAYALHTYKI